jgi:hypothetical protein
MALELTPPASDHTISLEEFTARCDHSLRPGNESSIAALAPDFAAFARNKSEFANYFCNEIATGAYAPKFDTIGTSYSDQCSIIARREGYYIRVASWDRPISRGGDKLWDERYFSYDFAHHHNFTLLTVGLLGPGYVTENFWLDTTPRDLLPNERVTIERRQDQMLAEGSVLMYRQWHDIHIQRPPAAFSLSLNLIVDGPPMPQYCFDVHEGKVLQQIGGKDIAKLRALRLAIDLGLDLNELALLDDTVPHLLKHLVQKEQLAND